METRRVGAFSFWDQILIIVFMRQHESDDILSEHINKKPSLETPSALKTMTVFHRNVAHCDGYH